MITFKKTKIDKGTVKSCHATFDDPWYEVTYVISTPDGPDIKDKVVTKNGNYPRKGDTVELVSTDYSWKINEDI